MPWPKLSIVDPASTALLSPFGHGLVQGGHASAQIASLRAVRPSRHPAVPGGNRGQGLALAPTWCLVRLFFFLTKPTLDVPNSHNALLVEADPKPFRCVDFGTVEKRGRCTDLVKHVSRTMVLKVDLVREREISTMSHVNVNISSLPAYLPSHIVATIFKSKHA